MDNSIWLGLIPTATALAGYLIGGFQQGRAEQRRRSYEDRRRFAGDQGVEAAKFLSFMDRSREGLDAATELKRHRAEIQTRIKAAEFLKDRIAVDEGQLEREQAWISSLGTRLDQLATELESHLPGARSSKAMLEIMANPSVVNAAEAWMQTIGSGGEEWEVCREVFIKEARLSSGAEDLAADIPHRS